MVIAMDDTITPELKLEGYYRDIVRHIQEARKEADYQVDDRIQVSISGADEVLATFKDNIGTETLSTVVDSLESYDVEKTLELDELVITLKLKK